MTLFLALSLGTAIAGDADCTHIRGDSIAISLRGNVISTPGIVPDEDCASFTVPEGAVVMPAFMSVALPMIVFCTLLLVLRWFYQQNAPCLQFVIIKPMFSVFLFTLSGPGGPRRHRMKKTERTNYFNIVDTKARILR